MSLSYLRGDCHKQAVTHIRVVAIRIDVHPAEENPTNTSHAFYTQSAYGPRPYVSHVVHI
jgi:hypothetical protein